MDDDFLTWIVHWTVRQVCTSTVESSLFVKFAPSDWYRHGTAFISLVASKLRRAIACSISLSLSLRKKFEKIVATPFLFSQRDGRKKTLASELFFLWFRWFFPQRIWCCIAKVLELFLCPPPRRSISNREEETLRGRGLEVGGGEYLQWSNALWCWRLRRLLTFPAADRIRLFAYQLVIFSLESTWKAASSKGTWLHGGDMRICLNVMFRSWHYI